MLRKSGALLYSSVFGRELKKTQTRTAVAITEPQRRTIPQGKSAKGFSAGAGAAEEEEA